MRALGVPTELHTEKRKWMTAHLNSKWRVEAMATGAGTRRIGLLVQNRVRGPKRLPITLQGLMRGFGLTGPSCATVSTFIASLVK
jgi:hypothetical protein